MTGDRDGDLQPARAATASEGEPASLLLHHVQGLHDPARQDAAYAFLYDAYYDRLRRFFSNRGVGAEKARDLTQDTFFRVFRGKGEFASEQEFEGWLFKIAINVHRNYQRERRAQKRQAREQSLEQWVASHGPAVPESAVREAEDPLEGFLVHERRVFLARALAELPAKMRRCVVFRLHHGWSYQEIADRLGVSIGTVKAHLHQGRARLTEAMVAYLQPNEPADTEDAEP